MALASAKSVALSVQLRHGVLFPGNVVEGVVFVTVTGQGIADYQALRVKIVGKEKVCIVEGDDDLQNDYFASNVLFKHLITLNGNAKSNSNPISQPLPPGQYHYPFAFQLPYDLPASFHRRRMLEDTIDVEYAAKAYIQAASEKRYVRHKAWFTVVRPSPQRQWSKKIPTDKLSSWQLTMCGCIAKGVVKADLSIEQSFLAMDRDAIVVTAIVDNSQGKEPVKSMTVSLGHHLSYHTEEKKDRDFTKEMTRVAKNEIAAGQRGRIETRLPLRADLIPSFCLSLMKSEYVVEIEFDIPWATDPSQQLPILLVQTVDEKNIVPSIGFTPATGKTAKAMEEEVQWNRFPNVSVAEVPIPAAFPYQGLSKVDLSNVQLKMPLPCQQGHYTAPEGWTRQKSGEDARFEPGASASWSGKFPQVELPPPTKSQPDLMVMYTQPKPNPGPAQHPNNAMTLDDQTEDALLL